MQFANVWERVADTVGDEIALINGDRKSSWSSFDSKAAKIATILQEHGLNSDSKVGIYRYILLLPLSQILTNFLLLI